MDRALAQRHGAAYVHLVAFAIDVDRVHASTSDAARLPFGWEVFLTELRLTRLMDQAEHSPLDLIEDACLSVMELPRPRGGELPAFGSQLPFAVYTGVERGLLPDALSSCFREWKTPPAHLCQAMDEMAKAPDLLTRLVEHCLDAAVQPPLIDLVRHDLTQLRQEAVAKP